MRWISHMRDPRCNTYASGSSRGSALRIASRALPCSDAREKSPPGTARAAASIAHRIGCCLRHETVLSAAASVVRTSYGCERERVIDAS
jgi:hypothetical protein